MIPALIKLLPLALKTAKTVVAVAPYAISAYQHMKAQKELKSQVPTIKRKRVVKCQHKP